MPPKTRSRRTPAAVKAEPGTTVKLEPVATAVSPDHEGDSVPTLTAIKQEGRRRVKREPSATAASTPTTKEVLATPQSLAERLPAESWIAAFEYLAPASSVGHLLLLRGVCRQWRDLIETQLDRRVFAPYLHAHGITKLLGAGFRLKSGNPSKRKPKFMHPDALLPSAAFNTVLKHVARYCMLCSHKFMPKHLRVWGPSFALTCVACRVTQVLASDHPGTPIALGDAYEQMPGCSDSELPRKAVQKLLGIPDAAMPLMPYRHEYNPHNPYYAPVKVYDLDLVGKVLYAVTGKADPVVLGAADEDADDCGSAGEEEEDE
ncbi:hypothetical protein H9P43_010066 [Blastocladiella emersonii ATCC 22665]|nr:hypothetical protein H9P43_010066 [Blastocladiella emersonii ATCC 22665]